MIRTIFLYPFIQPENLMNSPTGIPENTNTKLVSIAYVIVLVFLLAIFDVALYLFLKHILLDVFAWFNSIDVVFKIIILILGSVTIFGVLFVFVDWAGSSLSTALFKYFPLNKFMAQTSYFLAMGNALAGIIYAWTVPENYNFWIFLELWCISFFVLLLNSTVIISRHTEKFFLSSDSKNTRRDLHKIE